ncbi:MAG: carboxypeptidase-like regulatory domain-containing protein [Pyrinomonadaceae bacterium]|nr:carboxypeptidase-like regulatory domain-containing protein [Pyrinomonadaceae bacterium]
MKILRKISLSAFIVLAFAVTAMAQNVNVNPGGGSYATLADAFTAINAGTHTGAVTVSIVNDTTEPAAGAILNASGTGAASYTSIIITPSGARTVSGAATAGSPLIDFNGADNVTIDGLNTGGNSLTIANTTISATSGTSTIRFIGGATNNTITNSNVQGAGTHSVATNGAVIFFSTDAVTANGNDNNTISNNNIGPAGGNLPTKGILGNGSTTTTAIGNSGIVINNNNIFDFFNAAVTSSGVAVNGGCNTWTITNNRFYQTALRTWTTGATHRAIDLNSTTATSGVQGMTVTGNIVGYATNTQTGTYALTGSTGKFQGIVFNGITGGTNSVVNNNRVAEVSMTGVTSSGTSTSSPFVPILVINGVAETSNNTVGSQASINSLVFSTNTTTATDVYGMFNFSLNNWVSNNNNIGGIQVTNAGASGTFLVYGMRANTGTTLTWTASDNVVGGPLANTIALNATGTASQVVGMQTPNAISTLTRNRIRNLSTNIGTGTGTGASVAGIIFTSTTPNQTVTQNTISGLTNTNTTAASIVTGIQFTGGTANVVERNFIGFFSSATNSATAEVNGIRVGGGTTVYRNNMIILGTEITNALGGTPTNSSTTGINGFNGALGTDTFVNNSIYIGGSPTAGTGASYAFNGTQTVNTRSFRNNIFFNGRSNAGATGSNYAIKINGTAANPTGLTINNNVYFANGTGGILGFFNSLDFSTLAGWQAAVGQDANSIQANPLFVSNTDLHLQVGSPAIDQAANLGIANDFDGDSRPGLNALFDIGADERDGIPPVTNDIQATAFIDPANGGSKLVGSIFTPQASFTNNGIATQTNVTVRYRICADAGCSTVLYNNTAVIPTIATGVTVNVSFPSTSIGVAGSYTIKATAELVGDTVPGNNEIAGTLNILNPLSGTYTLGAGGNFTSLTNPGGVFDTINNLGATSNLTINITSDLLAETGAVALNEIPGGFTVFIKPSGAPRTISGSINGALIKINGADGVRIDGSTTATLADNLVGGNPATRQLTIQNTNTGTASWVIAIQSGTNGALNNTIQNVNIVGQDPTTTLGGISVGGATPGTVATVNNNGTRIQNCSFRRSIIGIYAAGVAAATPGTGTVITENDMTGATTNRIRRVGILTFNQDGMEISENYISGLDSNESADVIGIGVGTQGVDTTTVTSGGITNSTVTRNRIVGVNSNSASGFSAAGITVAGGTTGANIISNNEIAGVIANSTSPDFPVGIFVIGATGSNTRVIYNSVALTGNRGTTLTQMPSYGIAITGTDPTVELKNNVFFNTLDPGSGGTAAESYSIGMVTTTFVNLDSDYNDFYSAGVNPGFFRTGSLAISAGTDSPTIGVWRTVVSDDANSVDVDPLFLNPLDNLRLQPTSPVRNIGIPIAGITVDKDNQLRPNPTDALVVQVDIGADEFYAPASAPASISGKVTTFEGNGIRNAAVTLSGGNLPAPITVKTGSFGIFTFDNLAVGQTYIVTIESKRYVFTTPTRVVSLESNVTDLNFVSENQ